MGMVINKAIDRGTNKGMAMVWTIAKKIDKNIGYEKF